MKTLVKLVGLTPGLPPFGGVPALRLLQSIPGLPQGVTVSPAVLAQAGVSLPPEVVEAIADTYRARFKAACDD